MLRTMRLTPVTFTLVALASTASAHSYLRSAVPPVDSTVIQAPSEVTIAFTGSVEPRFSTIEITTADGQRVDDAKPHLAAGDAKRLAVGLRQLTPGTYTVAWHATSVDTHQTDGTYRFSIAATTPDVSLEHVWARPTAGLATTGAAYFTLTIKGQPDTLVGVSTPIAATAGLHETTNENGIMKMRPVPSIALAPGTAVSFQPGGYHVMLTGLKAPLKAGDSFPLTLTFEHGQPVTVTAKVEAAGGAGMGHAGMEGMPGMQGRHGTTP